MRNHELVVFSETLPATADDNIAASEEVLCDKIRQSEFAERRCKMDGVKFNGRRFAIIAAIIAFGCDGCLISQCIANDEHSTKTLSRRERSNCN